MQNPLYQREYVTEYQRTQNVFCLRIFSLIPLSMLFSVAYFN